jgi:hypothetical protein
MREWQLKIGDPLELTLAADVRLGPTSYTDDQIWQLTLGGGEPPALALDTTFGLRATSMRLFPRFKEGDETACDPASFAVQPVIHRLYPNYLRLTFAPFTGLDVESEVWVPCSQSIAGRIHLINTSALERTVQFEMAALLAPTDGQRMAPVEQKAATVLAGHTANLAPLLFLTGGPEISSGPYPALRHTLVIPPGGSRHFIWSQAALENVEVSFELARQIAARHWEAEIARLELLNNGLLEIYSGEPDWDAAFALAQKTALSLFTGPTDQLSAPSLLTTRQPDQGYSLRGDGTDYDHAWNGQDPLAAYFLSGLVLPGAPDLAKGLLRNFIHVQQADGSVDWKPGLAGQRSKLLATPMLASLAWRIYQTTLDRAFLKDVFPGLLRFVQAWFTPEHDRDGDGVPEWDHPMQAGYEDHPVFSRWHPWAQGVEISAAESPALCALLFNEYHVLVQMARLLERSEPLPALQSLADHLRLALETSWDPQAFSYRYWDRDTHQTPQSDLLGVRLGAGLIDLHQQFDTPVRLLVRIEAQDATRRHPTVHVHGTSTTGQHRVERIGDERFRWFLGQGVLTGERTYKSLEHVEVLGLNPDDRVVVTSIGFDCMDITTLLPLWAGIPDAERAAELVENTITPPGSYWHHFGLPACPCPPENADPDTCQSISLPWNSLIGEGLLRYGYRDKAAELVTRLMGAIVSSLKQDHAFRQFYHSETGQGLGEPNALSGLAPLELFLETLGVRIISAQRVFLNGFNPFPWPVTVKYRGLTVLCQKSKTMVIFPDGQTVTVDDPAPRMVALE